MKRPSDILKYGRIKPFFDKVYNFTTLDLETVENDLFMIGVSINNIYTYTLDNFYNFFHDYIIKCLQYKKDVLTWTKYDNTHLLKLILSRADDDDIQRALLNVGRHSPVYSYKYKTFDIEITTIIKDSILLKLTDVNGRTRNITLYNLKNLYDTDLLKTAKNYGLDYYSKLGEEFHKIDVERFHTDKDYKDNVILSNKLDNIVLKDIAMKMLHDFKTISGNLPKTIYTCGSLARSYLLSYTGVNESKYLSFNTLFTGRRKKLLLDYSMMSYHGGKIDSYVLGYIRRAKIIDINSAYPFAMSLLPRLKNEIIYGTKASELSKYFYAFILCDIIVEDEKLIHPVVVENPINKSNISPYGYITAVITKVEYDYMIEKGCKVKVKNFVAVGHYDNDFPYKDMITNLYNERLKVKTTNPSLSQMYKIILNSLYGITYELTDIYDKIDDVITWSGYRAGDYFMPPIASYITSIIRTYLSRVSHGIIKTGGKVLLNMTDSVVYTGDVETYDIFSDDKTLGKFSKPVLIKDLYVLGSGRYEYRDEFTNEYVIKSRGFNVSRRDKSFYGNLNLQNSVKIGHKTFVTPFKATTVKYNHEQLGYLIDDYYEINPFNLGGKRFVIDKNIDLNNEYTDTKAVYLERGILK